MTKEQPGLAWHLSVSYSVFPPLPSLSLGATYAVADGDVAASEKTMAVREKRPPPSLLLPTCLFPPSPAPAADGPR